jgi:hypothetical protein
MCVAFAAPGGIPASANTSGTMNNAGRIHPLTGSCIDRAITVRGIKQHHSLLVVPWSWPPIPEPGT